jgi:predicted ATPase
MGAKGSRAARGSAARKADDSLTARSYSRQSFCRDARGAMIHSIKIKGYRGFADFGLNGLGRINLLVGKNNSGKTAILEAIQLLASSNDLQPLWRILSRRGEQAVPEVVPGRPVQFEVDVSHLFMGHEAKVGSELSVVTTNQKPGRSFKFQIEEAKPKENPAAFAQIANEEPAGSLMALKISGSPNLTLLPIPLTSRGTLRQDTFTQAASMARRPKPEGFAATQYISNDSIPGAELSNIWNSIVLTPEEESVVAALKFLEPNIDRIAAVSSPYLFATGATRGGFVVRLKDSEKRIPVGSFGDGMWRILALACAISRAKGGLLLVDEIDTGLHFTAMADMWKLIDNASKAFNVQVFATTHSYDCVHSLASICKDEDGADGITIQRIETGLSEAVAFTESEIRVAAQRHIEMR